MKNIIIAALVISSFCLKCKAAPGGDIIAVVANVSGSVKLLVRDSLKWEKAAKGRYLYEGDKVRTDAVSLADICFMDNIEIKMNTGTLIEIMPLDKGGSRVVLKLGSGQLWARTALPRVYGLLVDTDIASLYTKGAIFDCEVYTKLAVKVYKGEVIENNEFGEAQLKEGEQNSTAALSKPETPKNSTGENLWSERINIPVEKTLYLKIKGQNGRKTKIELKMKRSG